MDRRKFLRHLGLLTGAGTVSMTLGDIPLKAFARPLFNATAADGKVIVLVQLGGGNDGLNTVVPYQDSNYHNARPSIRIRENDVLRLSNSIGLHPSLDPFKSLYDEGQLAVVQNVGYPNPNRSHFRSTDIWLSASDSNEYIEDGWVGRFLAKAFPEPETYNTSHPMAIQIGASQSMLLQCTCQGQMGISFEDPNQFYQLINGSTADNDPPPNTIAGEQLRYVKQIAAQSIQYAQVIKDVADTVENKVQYPNSSLGRQLAIVAELIAGGLETPVYLTSVGGFDTHSNQSGSHANLLQNLANSVSAFMQDLKLLGVADRVVVMTFSEFGRRVEQNGSAGTDHGTAAPLFVIGQNVKSGIVGNNPNLEDLDNNGDLKYEFDFRQVYATLLQDQLGMSADKMGEVLFGNFETLPLISVKHAASGGPVSFTLQQNYPNPFNPETKINYSIRIPQFIRLVVYDPTGAEVVTLDQGWKDAGNYTATFGDGRYPSGVYYCRLISGSYKQTIKMILIK
jgi:uncharacterized protein (DUF1501 family)